MLSLFQEINKFNSCLYIPEEKKEIHRMIPDRFSVLTLFSLKRPMFTVSCGVIASHFHLSFVFMDLVLVFSS